LIPSRGGGGITVLTIKNISCLTVGTYLVLFGNVNCKISARGENFRFSRGEDKKTGLLSQGMTQKPGEFSDSVLLEDYVDRSNSRQYYAIAGNFPGR
jgi:hypothetical protein